MSVDPGRFRHRVTIQEATETKTAGGSRTKTWANVATNPEAWAEVKDLTGNERFRAQAVDAGMTKQVTLYYRADVTAKMRLLHEGQALMISGPPVDPFGDKRFMILYCSVDA